MSRSKLHIQAFIFRIFQTIGRYCDLYLSTPLPKRPSFKLNIPSTVGSVPGTFNLLFYAPPSYFQNLKKPIQGRKLYPVLLNFHGGGYTIGHAADDARWATTAVQNTECVVVSVDYRLAPSYPFPTGIEDCVSAILYIWQHADSLSLDRHKMALSGFSAGGNFTYTACYRLHEELVHLKREDRLHGVEIGDIICLISFYPAADWTKSRAERAASNPNFTPMIPPIMSNLFEGSYLFPPPTDMGVPLLSPGLASDELVKQALPDKMVLITCWGDGLLNEAEIFRKRLRALGKRIDGYTVQNVPHGWDKWPSWWKGNVSRDEAYQSAAESLKEFWNEESSPNST